MRRPLPENDLDLVLNLTPLFWERFAGARIFATGCTGFIGSWLLETIKRANQILGSKIEVVVLSRNPDHALKLAPHVFSTSGFSLIYGSVTDFKTEQGAFDLCIHAAADVADPAKAADQLAVFDAAVGGTRRVLDFAVQSGVSKVLLTSSGAVYGPLPAALPKVPEDYAGAPDVLNHMTAYAQGKRAAEWLASAYARDQGLEVGIARIFALLGPNIPLNGPFAAGNFIRDALNGTHVDIRGDGRPLRSYLYAADACVWLLHILMQAGSTASAYNVGSEAAISIADLARLIVSKAAPDTPIHIHTAPDHSVPAPHYVPDTDKARTCLGLNEYTSLDMALEKTLLWYREDTNNEKI